VGRKFYVFGGKSGEAVVGDDVRGDLWMFDLDTCTWSELHPHPSTVKTVQGGAGSGWSSHHPSLKCVCACAGPKGHQLEG
jgi:hypothetical protein